MRGKAQSRARRTHQTYNPITLRWISYLLFLPIIALAFTGEELDFNLDKESQSLAITPTNFLSELRVHNGGSCYNETLEIEGEFNDQSQVFMTCDGAYDGWDSAPTLKLSLDNIRSRAALVLPLQKSATGSSLVLRMSCTNYSTFVFSTPGVETSFNVRYEWKHLSPIIPYAESLTKLCTQQARAAMLNAPLRPGSEEIPGYEWDSWLVAYGVMFYLVLFIPFLIAAVIFSLASSLRVKNQGSKSFLLAALLLYPMPWFGLHRLYFRHWIVFAVYVLTLGGLGIWALIEIILLPWTIRKVGVKVF